MKKIAILATPCLLLLTMSYCSLGTYQLTADSGRRNIGINLFASQLDWVRDRLFADVMKTSRAWTAAGQLSAGPAVPVDSDGWPTGDAETVVWAGIDRMNGTYRLEGDCAQRPTVTTGYGDASVSGLTWANGKFSADIAYRSTDGTGLLLTFTNTGSGVRNVKLMRPRSVGSAESYPDTEAFTDQAKRMVAGFDAVRFMWSVDGWNGPNQVEWADRVSPSACSFNRNANAANVGWAGTGMAWEYAVRFCNETGKDMWINMPLGASDDYVRRLAQLIKDDYTVPGGKVYWEYSNEATWDASQVCASYLRAKGLAEAQASGPVSYDGQRTDPNVLAARYYCERAAQMSLVWRSVWGDEAMMTRIRPVASGQLGYDSELFWGLDFIHNYFGNVTGSYVAVPHPVSYFFYGCGGSHYTGDSPEAVKGGATEIGAFESSEEEEACQARMYGLARCAYEGGVWTNARNHSLPRIADAMVRYHALWDKYGGDLLMYYVSTGGEDNGTALGFSDDAYNLDTPKYRALAQIRSAQKPAPTAGKMAPCVIQGADYSMNSTAWEHPAAGGAETAGGGQLDEWRTFKGYLFRTSLAGRRSLTLSYAQTAGARIEIMIDGTALPVTTLTGTASPEFSVELPAGLHAVRIAKLDPGYFLLRSLTIK